MGGHHPAKFSSDRLPRPQNNFKKATIFRAIFRLALIAKRCCGDEVDRHCGSEDIMVLVCHVISQDHVTKRLGNFMSRNP